MAPAPKLPSRASGLKTQRIAPLKRSIAFGAAALFCLINLNAWADTPSQAPVASVATKGSVREACSHDIQTQCAGVKTGGGRIRACMKQHFKDFSPSCKQAIRQNRKHPQSS